MIELKLTWKEAQGLMRAPAKAVPSSFVVEGCEFEEFEVPGNYILNFIASQIMSIV